MYTAYDENGDFLWKSQNLYKLPGNLIARAHKIVRQDGFVIKDRTGPVGVYEVSV